MIRTRTSAPFGRPLISPSWRDIGKPLAQAIEQRVTSRSEMIYAARVRGCSGRREWSAIDRTTCRDGASQEVTSAIRVDGLIYPINVDPGAAANAGFSASFVNASPNASIAAREVIVCQSVDATTGARKCFAWDASTGYYLGKWEDTVKPAIEASLAMGSNYIGTLDEGGAPTCPEYAFTTASRWALRPGTGGS